MASMKALRDANRAQRRRLEQAEALLREAIGACDVAIEFAGCGGHAYRVKKNIVKFLGTPIDVPTE